MKHIFLFAALATAVLFSSCEGPEGPPGEPGINILGQVFETTVNLQYEDYPINSYSRSITIPTDIVVYESDVILVYRLDGFFDGEDVWAQLPQSRFFPDATGDFYQYQFDNTFFDVKFYIDGNFDLALLNSNATDNQTFRIAIVPAEYADANFTMEELMQGLKINPTEIETISN